MIGRRSNNVIMMVAARGYKNISSKLLISLPNTKKKNLLVGDVSIDYQFNFFLYDNQNTPRIYINNVNIFLSTVSTSH